MNDWLLVVAVPAAAWEYYLGHFDSPGHHRCVTAARAARCRGAERRARRDRDVLIACLSGRPAR